MEDDDSFYFGVNVAFSLVGYLLAIAWIYIILTD